MQRAATWNAVSACCPAPGRIIFWVILTARAGALKQLLPMKPGPMAAMGLLIALITAVVPVIFGKELLRSWHNYIPLPGGGEYHFTSVTFFDLGVLIVVVAVSVGIINRLTEELE